MPKVKSAIDGKYKTKEFAKENPDTTFEVKETKNLTKIFDLWLNDDPKAVQRVQKLSENTAKKLYVVVKGIVNEIEVAHGITE